MGGDELAIARRLILADKKIDLFIIGQAQRGSTDFQRNFQIFKNMKVPLTILTQKTSLHLLDEALKRNTWTIDAIFGIGLNKTVKGLHAQIIKNINQLSNNVLAVNLPSGLDGDSGEVLGVAVKANRTISFHRLKQGLTKNKNIVAM